LKLKKTAPTSPKDEEDVEKDHFTTEDVEMADTASDDADAVDTKPGWHKDKFCHFSQKLIPQSCLFPTFNPRRR
jgi:hypothetical protein